LATISYAQTEPTTLISSSTPTNCPTPKIGDYGSDLIEGYDTTVMPNGRIYLSISYFSAVVTNFDITMDKPGFDYSNEDANGWTEDLEMCWSSINREFTYNQMSQAMDFEIYATDVIFGFDTSYEYSQQKSITIGGKVHEWTETHTKSKHMPFKFTTASESVITTAFSGKNPPFIIDTRAPMISPDVISTIVPYISTETAQKDQNSLLEVQFTTIVNMPWKLIEPKASGGAITNLLSFEPTKQDTCDNFEDLQQDFLRDSVLYCQRWVLRFRGDRHCNNQLRTLHIDFISEADNGQRSETILSWDLDLGSSPAFECARDLGTFQVSVQVEGHNDANRDFTPPSKAYLDEFYYFRFTGSSGAPVTSMSVTNFDVQNAETSKFLCQACQLKEELKWSLKDTDVDNYITALELDSSVFAGLRFVTFDFTIEVEMSTETGRRRLTETGEKLHQKVTLSLDSSTRQVGERTDPPIVHTSSTSIAPTPFATTKTPVATENDGNDDDIMETEADASESASESSQKVRFGIFIAIGAVASAIAAAVAYLCITQSNDKDMQFKDAITPSDVGSTYNPSLKIDVKA